MRRSQVPMLAILPVAVLANACLAAPPRGEVAMIETLSGCFDVSYIFVEDGEHDTFAKGRPLRTKEWVGLWRSEDGRLILPHVSITPDGRAVAHWHEIWVHRPDQDAWSQQVWRELPGAPGSRQRYACTAPWTANRWQCHAGRAPKPFRDAGAPFGFDRTDYEWLDRENVLLVTDEGWVHNEHNKKISADGTVVSYELGWITYDRIPEDACQVAVEAYGEPILPEGETEP